MVAGARAGAGARVCVCSDAYFAGRNAYRYIYIYMYMPKSVFSQTPVSPIGRGLALVLDTTSFKVNLTQHNERTTVDGIN